MTSASQQEANFANAQKSTGPKTEKGKHRTRLNACLIAVVTASPARSAFSPPATLAHD
jgi:hypothetical protein